MTTRNHRADSEILTLVLEQPDLEDGLTVSPDTFEVFVRFFIMDGAFGDYNICRVVVSARNMQSGHWVTDEALLDALDRSDRLFEAIEAMRSGD